MILQKKIDGIMFNTLLKMFDSELVLCTTISQPDGNPYGDSSECRMYTAYCFNDDSKEFISVNCTWNKNKPEKRVFEYILYL